MLRFSAVWVSHVCSCWVIVRSSRQRSMASRYSAAVLVGGLGQVVRAMISWRDPFRVVLVFRAVIPWGWPVVMKVRGVGWVLPVPWCLRSWAMVRASLRAPGCGGVSPMWVAAWGSFSLLICHVQIPVPGS